MKFLQQFSGILILLAAGAIHTQILPTKPIRIVTGGAGGVLDFSARVLA